MNKTDDGGPAFPRDYEAVQRGMTLRDYFAAKAMHGFMSSGTSFGDWFPKEVAQLAYDQADAMLKAREAKP